jgi:hypothetical protein
MIRRSPRRLERTGRLPSDDGQDPTAWLEHRLARSGVVGSQDLGFFLRGPMDARSNELQFCCVVLASASWRAEHGWQLFGCAETMSLWTTYRGISTATLFRMR